MTAFKSALVTGAPGFVGTHLVRALLARGVNVRGLALPGESVESLDGLDVQITRGDVLEADAVRRAVADVDVVFHCAAIYQTWAPDPSPMYRVNLIGTLNVLQAARDACVERVVCTASIAALGRPGADKLGSETTAHEAWDLDFPYARSKLFGMWLARAMADWGLHVVVVAPGIVLGPGDRAPTPSGRLLLGLARNRVPGYCEGGCSYVDVRDAAEAHVLAAERGTSGELYVAAGHPLSNKEFLKNALEALERRALLVRLPQQAVMTYVRALESLAVRKGEIPDVASVFFRYGLRACYYDSSKAQEELGLKFRPIGDTLRDAVADFRARGAI